MLKFANRISFQVAINFLVGLHLNRYRFTYLHTYSLYTFYLHREKGTTKRTKPFTRKLTQSYGI